MPSKQTPENQTLSASNSADTSLPRARLGRLLRTGMSAVWDRLGLVIAVSLTWTFLLTLVFSVGRLMPLAPIGRTIGMLVVALLLAAPGAGAFHLMHLVCTQEEFSYWDLWKAAHRLALPAMLLALLSLAVFALFAVNVWFYLNVRSLFGGVAALLCAYAVVFWLMMAVYHFPVLVAQEAGVFDDADHRAQRGVMGALRRAFYLALGAPFFTLGLVAATILPTLLMFLTAIPFALLGLGGVAMVTTVATRGLLIQFGVIAPPSAEEAVPDEQFRIRSK